VSPVQTADGLGRGWVDDAAGRTRRFAACWARSVRAQAGVSGSSCTMTGTRQFCAIRLPVFRLRRDSRVPEAAASAAWQPRVPAAWPWPAPKSHPCPRAVGRGADQDRQRRACSWPRSRAIRRLAQVAGAVTDPPGRAREPAGAAPIRGHAAQWADHVPRRRASLRRGRFLAGAGECLADRALRGDRNRVSKQPRQPAAPDGQATREQRRKSCLTSPRTIR
jgi:hypothetical protein